MFERFSERARQVVVLAQEEARGLDHSYIGTEHLLIAVLREEVGVAPAVLAAASLTAEEARAAVIRIVGRGEAISSGMVPFTPRAQRVLELGSSKARRLRRRQVGPEDLLLALLTEGEGVAARILADVGADGGAIRGAVIGFDVEWPEGPGAEGVGPLGELPEVEIDLGWRGRPIALAALGAALIARSAFDPIRTGMLDPIEMQLLVHLALAARPGAGGSSGEEIDSLSGALVCDRDDVRAAVGSLLRQGLAVGPAEENEDRLAIAPAGVARVEQWLRRSVVLFGGWPPTVPGVDDV
jgi:Clp amino terminal domain, pathogenicity island component